jgi:branched-chain amino acid transport system permease protein
MGFNIIYSSTGIINFAQGEFSMFGGLLAFTFAVTMGLPLPLALVLAVVVCALIGGVTERLVIYPLRHASILVAIIATVSRQFLWVVGLTALSVLLVYFFFNYTKAGKAMRACSVNRQAASLVGINVSQMSLYSFVLAGALGGMAGFINAPFAKYSIGLFLGIKGFTAAIVGGLGNTFGAVAGGLFLGLVEELTAGFLTVVLGVSSGFKEAIAAIVLILILLWRPQGILGKGVVEKV